MKDIYPLVVAAGCGELTVIAHSLLRIVRDQPISQPQEGLILGIVRVLLMEDVEQALGMSTRTRVGRCDAT